MGERVGVRKTYKLYIDGKFPRSESGRTFPFESRDHSVAVHLSRASRKDLRMAVRAARGALTGWKERSGYNRGQIMYRIAEMVEDRAETFVAQLALSGSLEAARREVEEAIDLLIWYAGWCDKYIQVIGNMNPVAGPFFNISTPEPVGVVGVLSSPAPALLGLVGGISPVMVSGNTAVVVASPSQPLDRGYLCGGPRNRRCTGGGGEHPHRFLNRARSLAGRPYGRQRPRSVGRCFRDDRRSGGGVFSQLEACR